MSVVCEVACQTNKNLNYFKRVSYNTSLKNLKNATSHEISNI